MQVIEQGVIVPVHYETNLVQSEVQKLILTFAQDDKILIEKTENDVVWGDGEIIVNLSQEDTFLMDPKKSGEVQLKVKLTDGGIAKTEVEPFRVGKSLNKEVL